jgi:hypothetical protein
MSRPVVGQYVIPSPMDRSKRFRRYGGKNYISYKFYSKKLKTAIREIDIEPILNSIPIGEIKKMAELDTYKACVFEGPSNVKIYFYIDQSDNVCIRFERNMIQFIPGEEELRYLIKSIIPLDENRFKKTKSARN